MYPRYGLYHKMIIMMLTQINYNLCRALVLDREHCTGHSSDTYTLTSNHVLNNFIRLSLGIMQDLNCDSSD